MNSQYSKLTKTDAVHNCLDYNEQTKSLRNIHIKCRNIQPSDFRDKLQQTPSDSEDIFVGVIILPCM